MGDQVIQLLLLYSYIQSPASFTSLLKLAFHLTTRQHIADVVAGTPHDILRRAFLTNVSTFFSVSNDVAFRPDHTLWSVVEKDRRRHGITLRPELRRVSLHRAPVTAKGTQGVVKVASEPVHRKIEQHLLGTPPGKGICETADRRPSHVHPPSKLRVLLEVDQARKLVDWWHGLVVLDNVLGVQRLVLVFIQLLGEDLTAVAKPEKIPAVSVRRARVGTGAKERTCAFGHSLQLRLEPHIPGVPRQKRGVLVLDAVRGR